MKDNKYWLIVFLLGAVVLAMVLDTIGYGDKNITSHENKPSKGIDSIIATIDQMEENIVYLPENTIIKQVYMIGGKETYLLEDTVQNIYEKCHLMEGELVSEIIFIQN